MTDEKLTQEQADEKVINEAFEELLNRYLESRHRKKVEIITKAFNDSDCFSLNSLILFPKIMEFSFSMYCIHVIVVL